MSEPTSRCCDALVSQTLMVSGNHFYTCTNCGDVCKLSNPTDQAPSGDALEEILHELQIKAYDGDDAEKTTRKHDPYRRDRAEAKGLIERLLVEARLDERQSLIAAAEQIPRHMAIAHANTPIKDRKDAYYLLCEASARIYDLTSKQLKDTL